MSGNVKVEITLQILDPNEWIILKWIVNNITAHLKWNVRVCAGFICFMIVSTSEMLCVRNERTIFEKFDWYDDRPPVLDNFKGKVPLGIKDEVQFSIADIWINICDEENFCQAFIKTRRTVCSWNRTWYSLSVLCRRESTSWCLSKQVCVSHYTEGVWKYFRSVSYFVTYFILIFQ